MAGIITSCCRQTYRNVIFTHVIFIIFIILPINNLKRIKSVSFQVDGWDFRMILESNPKLQGIPVIICTTSGTFDRSIDAKAIIKKPIDLNQLLKNRKVQRLKS
jgi:hypothetical protein